MDSLYTIEDKPAFRAIGWRRRIDGPKEDSFEKVKAFFAEANAEGLLAQLAPLSAVEPLGILGIYDFRGRENHPGFDLWIAVASEAEAADGLESIDIPAATYLVLTATGTFLEVLMTLEKRVNEQLRLSPFVHAGSPDIEVHPFGQGEKDIVECTLWIPIMR